MSISRSSCQDAIWIIKSPHYLQRLWRFRRAEIRKVSVVEVGRGGRGTADRAFILIIEKWYQNNGNNIPRAGLDAKDASADLSSGECSKCQSQDPAAFWGNVKKRIWAYAWQTATFVGLRLVRVFLFWRFYPRGSCSVVHFLSLSLSPPAVITLIPFTCAALAAIHIMYSPGLCALSSLFAILSKHAFCLYGCLVFPGVDCSGLPFSVHYWNFRHDNWLLPPPPLTCFLFLQAFGFWLNRMKGTSSA